MTDDLSPTETLLRLDDRCLSMVQYWDGLRKGRPVPARVEVSPADIARHLSRVCILERPRAGTVRIRLAGATLSQRMGMELRGMPFRSLFELDDRAAAMDAAESAMVTPAVSVLSLARAGQLGTQHEAQMAILPLSDPHGGLTRAIALYSEAAAITPYVTDLRGRFQVEDHIRIEIPEGAPLDGLAETAAPIAVVPRGNGARFRKAQHATAEVPARVEARTLEHHARPVFQVIEGGRS